MTEADRRLTSRIAKDHGVTLTRSVEPVTMGEADRRERLRADLALRLNAEVNRLALHYGCTRGELLSFARQVLQGEHPEPKPKGDRHSVGEDA